MSASARETPPVGLQFAVLLDENYVRAVHHDLAHAPVLQKLRDRIEPSQAVKQIAPEADPLLRRHGPDLLLPRQRLIDLRPDLPVIGRPRPLDRLKNSGSQSGKQLP